MRRYGTLKKINSEWSFDFILNSTEPKFRKSILGTQTGYSFKNGDFVETIQNSSFNK